jgi:2-polyprenyl-3-methyl-5-hydroxy-6-metoxy-1,4-benzoquinol methylase
VYIEPPECYDFYINHDHLEENPLTKHIWETFFDSHAEHYMKNGFTKHTLQEVDFLIEELKLPPGSRILDIGCGTGRHSIELTRRGYSMTGVDISTGMLREAETAAKEAGVTVEWVHSDAVQFEATRPYDAVICLCEGAFGLLNRDEDPTEHALKIFGNMNHALKPGAQLVLTTLNAYAKIRELTQEDIDAGRFDPVTMIESHVTTWDLPEGKKEVQVRERRYFPSELRLLLQTCGFAVENIWGGTAGNWKRKALNLDEIEIMLVARKK